MNEEQQPQYQQPMTEAEIERELEAGSGPKVNIIVPIILITMLAAGLWIVAGKPGYPKPEPPAAIQWGGYPFMAYYNSPTSSVQGYLNFIQVGFKADGTVVWRSATNAPLVMK